MKVQTPVGSYELVQMNDPAVVRIHAPEREDLVHVVHTLELFGATDNPAKLEYELSQIFQHERAGLWYIDLEPSDAALWLQAEVLNFL